ncbi:hypothetical protein N0V84_005284 [Fusarium piperis]|uniref:Uncharacterized protein n=1 Tax=Fusarium piperis TaxID=1435070 RepID=A0A9W8WDZ3_9HYPO|nr:hypothetical protein N0V84_005284 [Fusarium piperis]
MDHHGGEGEGGKTLMQGEWRDGSLQQYQRAPLENVYKLDKQMLLKQWGYSPAILQSISYYSAAAGVIIEAADVKVAETVIIDPSGGSFDGLAVEMALTLGANVIALAVVGTFKRKGRVVLSGGTPGHLEMPYHVIVHKDLQIKRKWMCEKQTLDKLIKMMESGNLKPVSRVV